MCALRLGSRLSEETGFGIVGGEDVGMRGQCRARAPVSLGGRSKSARALAKAASPTHLRFPEFQLWLESLLQAKGLLWPTASSLPFQGHTPPFSLAPPLRVGAGVLSPAQWVDKTGPSGSSNVPLLSLLPQP